MDDNVREYFKHKGNVSFTFTAGNRLQVTLVKIGKSLGKVTTYVKGVVRAIFRTAGAGETDAEREEAGAREMLRQIRVLQPKVFEEVTGVASGPILNVEQSLAVRTAVNLNWAQSRKLQSWHIIATGRPLFAAEQKQRALVKGINVPFRADKATVDLGDGPEDVHYCVVTDVVKMLNHNMESNRVEVAEKGVYELSDVFYVRFTGDHGGDEKIKKNASGGLTKLMLGVEVSKSQGQGLYDMLAMMFCAENAAALKATVWTEVKEGLESFEGQHVACVEGETEGGKRGANFMVVKKGADVEVLTNKREPSLGLNARARRKGSPNPSTFLTKVRCQGEATRAGEKMRLLFGGKT